MLIIIWWAWSKVCESRDSKIKKITLIILGWLWSKIRVFQIAVRSWQQILPLPPPTSHSSGRGIGNFAEGEFFTKCWGSEEWFWPFKPFSKLKTAFYEYWTPIKIKLAWSVCLKSMNLKQKWYMSNDYF